MRSTTPSRRAMEVSVRAMKRARIASKRSHVAGHGGTHSVARAVAASDAGDSRERYRQGTQRLTSAAGSPPVSS